MMEIAEKIAASKKIVIVSGAGISQESGIPTFRGKDGYWKNYDPMMLATIQAFERDPKLVWGWYEDRRRAIRAAKPNPGHIAAAELARLVPTRVITQNIDSLHQRAGSKDILELHGNIMRVFCVKCHNMVDAPDDYEVLPPFCPCGGMLRPDVVWFGEQLPQDVWEEAIRESGECDVMIIVGTSLVVSPANMLPSLARDAGALLIEINPASSEMSYMMDHIIKDTASSALPELLGHIKAIRARRPNP